MCHLDRQSRHVGYLIINQLSFSSTYPLFIISAILSTLLEISVGLSNAEVKMNKCPKAAKTYSYGKNETDVTLISLVSLHG